jgi:predicted amidohydrolase YtcJ
MMRRLATSGAKALYKGKYLFAALKRCATRKLGNATQELNAAVESHLSQKTRKMGHPAFVVVFIAIVCSAQAPAPGSAPTPAPSSAQAPAPTPSSAPEKTDVRPRADAIYVHANVYTGVASNTGFSSVLREEAIAVRGDRIQAVGKNLDVLKLKGPETEVIDLGGRFVMPGFNDAQVHLAEAGLQKLSIDVTGVKTLEEFRARVKARVEKAGPDEWILGAGWDETIWPVPTLPSRWDLDQVSDGHPVLLDRADGRLAVANTRALQLGSITLASRDPEGGEIDRDANGQPTGILRGTAQQAVRSAIPQLTREARRRGIEVALADLAEHGVTSAQDYSPVFEDFQIYEELEKDGKLTARISECLPFDDVVDELKVKRGLHPQSDLMLHTGMVKGFIDGSLGGHTAALLEPYEDDAKQSGLSQYEAEKLNEMVKERVLAGFQLGLDAIGDRAIQMALDPFAEAEKAAKEAKVKGANGGDDFRLRIEEAEVTTPAQFARFKELKVIAAVPPSHLLTEMRWAQERLGQKRAATSYAWATLANKGVTLAFGTDYPVESVSPFRGLYAAVTRKSENGKQEFFPEQKLTMDQAIAAYTSGSAFAEFEEKEKGKLAPGMLADFVVLDRDVTAASAEKELATKVLRTVVGGKTVYEAK